MRPARSGFTPSKYLISRGAVPRATALGGGGAQAELPGTSSGVLLVLSISVPTTDEIHPRVTAGNCKGRGGNECPQNPHEDNQEF